MTRASRAEAAGAWSQESMDGLRALAARSAAAARASGGVCRWAAQWGSAGSAAPSARVRTRVLRAWGAGAVSGGSRAAWRRRRRRGAACGQGPRGGGAGGRGRRGRCASNGRSASGPRGLRRVRLRRWRGRDIDAPFLHGTCSTGADLGLPKLASVLPCRRPFGTRPPVRGTAV